MNEPQRIIISVEQAEPKPANWIGGLGFVFSLLGFVTCGFSAILGVIFGIIGVLHPRSGVAWASLLIGIPQVILLALGIPLMNRANEMAAEVRSKNEQKNEQSEPLLTNEDAPKSEPPKDTQEGHQDDSQDGSLPLTPKVEAEKEDKPYEVKRFFSDRSGKFTVEATVVSAGAGMISLKRIDNQKIVTIEVEKLSDFDQEWISRNFPD